MNKNSSIKPRLTIALFILGVLLALLGIVFTPPFVAKYVKHTETLNPYLTDKVLLYQLYTITLGCLVIFVSALVYSRAFAKILFLPLLIAYLLLVYGFYINKKYPDNILAKPSELVKTWHVLLGNDLALTDYQPKAVLKVKNKEVNRARYPVIDVHFHFGSLENINSDELVKSMDAAGISKIVNLDGAPGDFEKFTREFRDKYPDRFMMFVRLNLHEINEPNFLQDQITRLESAVRMGAKGLKVIKNLGLEIKDETGKLIPIDDPRLDPIWDKAGELGIPVLIHVTDPTPFFQPVGRFNERYEELKRYPGWSFYGPKFPSKEALLEQRENLVRKHPGTNFIAAHFGDNPEDLEYAAGLMDKYPNYYVDMSSRLPELGRQPFTARDFFIKHQDRILFGSDGGFGLGRGGWTVEKFYGTYFQFLETTNEYFDYPLWGIYTQGRWKIYGLNLPDEVLEKIYYKNAARILGLEE